MQSAFRMATASYSPELRTIVVFHLVLLLTGSTVKMLHNRMYGRGRVATTSVFVLIVSLRRLKFESECLRDLSSRMSQKTLYYPQSRVLCKTTIGRSTHEQWPHQGRPTEVGTLNRIRLAGGNRG